MIAAEIEPALALRSPPVLLIPLLVIGLSADRRADATPTSPASRAPASPVHLRYSLDGAAQQCPTEAALRNAVAARLGYEPWDAQAARVIIVAVGREGPSLHARVELRETDGKIAGLRELSSAQGDCSELAAAVELAISIAIDTLSFAGSRRAEQPAVPRGENGRGPARDLASRARAIEPARTRVAASVGGLLGFAAAPSPVSGGVTLQGRLQGRRASLGVEARVDLPAYRAVPGGEVSSALLLGGLLGCYHYTWLLGCGLLELGALRAAGHGLPGAASATLFYAAGGARLAVELPLVSVVALRLHGDLLLTLSRVTLRETATQAEIWSTPPLSGTVGLATVAVLP